MNFTLSQAQIDAYLTSSKNLSNLSIFNITASSLAFVLLAYGFLDKDPAAYKRGAWNYVKSDDGVLCLALLMMAACEIIEATVFFVHPLGSSLPQYSCETNYAFQVVQNLFYPLFYYFNYVFLVKKSFIANRHTRKIRRDSPVFSIAWIISLMSITVIVPIDFVLVTYSQPPQVIFGYCIYAMTLVAESVKYCAITLTIVNVALLYTFIVPLYRNAQTISTLGEGSKDRRAAKLRRTARANVLLVGINVVCQSTGFIIQSIAMSSTSAFTPLTPMWSATIFSSGLLQIDPIIALVCLMCMTDIWMGKRLKRAFYRAREAAGYPHYSSSSRGGARVTSSDHDRDPYMSSRRGPSAPSNAVREASVGGAVHSKESSSRVTSFRGAQDGAALSPSLVVHGMPAAAAPPGSPTRTAVAVTATVEAPVDEAQA